MRKLFFILALVFSGMLIQAQEEYYNDGNLFLYYEENGVRVSMHLNITRSYGKYYQSYIVVENLSSNTFLFNPEEVKAIIKKSDEKKEVYALTSDEYLKKVHRQNNWTSAMYAFNASYNAAMAGYNSSSAYGYSNMYSYDYVANYYAQQNAANNIHAFNKELLNINQILHNGYLRKHTLMRGKVISGYVNIKYKKADEILIIIPVNGKNYKFKYNFD